MEFCQRPKSYLWNGNVQKDRRNVGQDDVIVFFVIVSASHNRRQVGRVKHGGGAIPGNLGHRGCQRWVD